MRSDSAAPYTTGLAAKNLSQQPGQVQFVLDIPFHRTSAERPDYERLTQFRDWWYARKSEAHPLVRLKELRELIESFDQNIGLGEAQFF